MGMAKRSIMANSYSKNWSANGDIYNKPVRVVD